MAIQKQRLILRNFADSQPAGVICEIMSENGEMARVPELIEMAQKHNLKMITIADLVRYRYEKEHVITREAAFNCRVSLANFRMNGYSNLLDDKEHLALYTGRSFTRGGTACSYSFSLFNR